jgi:hypothetical protein
MDPTITTKVVTAPRAGPVRFWKLAWTIISEAFRHPLTTTRVVVLEPQERESAAPQQAH